MSPRPRSTWPRTAAMSWKTCAPDIVLDRDGFAAKRRGFLGVS
ncbi:hypothetical protein [Mycobacterium sp.]|nr:hypothetical protein [Mycobacterium sp.]HTH92187.1 hypothetical protein [Mycobacterium sp.]